MKKNHICLILVSMILIVICGAVCGCDKGAGASDPGFIYLPEYVSLPGDIQSIDQSCYNNGTLYFTSYGKTGEREPAAGDPQPGDDTYYEGYYDIYGAALYKINIDGSGFEQLSGYTQPTVAEDKQGNASLNGLTIDDEGNIWVAESYNYYHIDNSDQWVDDGSKIFLRKLDQTGAELDSIDISSLAADTEYFYISQILFGKDGYIYLTDGNMTVYALDSTGQVAFTLSVDNWINQFVMLSDGTLATTAYEETGMVMKEIDSTAKAWGETIDLPDMLNQIYPGSGNYDFYYSDTSNLYGYNLSSNTPEKLVNWIGSDIDGYNINRIYPLEDGRILCIMYSYNENNEGSQEMALLTKHDSSTVPKKTTLTMASMYLDSNIRSAIIKFNKTNSEYRIELNDYSIYNTDEDYQAGLLKLNTEIISGQIPDILAIGSLPIKQYAAKGLLEDLYSYIDNDEELGGRNAFMESVFSAIQVGDMLPYIAANFSVVTAVGNSQVVGDEPGWTIDELNAALATMPEGCRPFAYMDQNSALYYLCAIGMDEYVDWNTGECHFDSPGFVKLLEFVKTFPEIINWDEPQYMRSEEEMINNGEVMLTQLYLSDFQNYQYYKNMYGGDITFKGYPSENGIGSVFSIDSGLAISSKCKHKDVAWDFIRFILTEDYQTNNSWYGYPTNKAVFNAMMDEAMKDDGIDDSGGGSILYKEGYAIEDDMMGNTPLTQEEADQIISLINSVDYTMSYDTEIMAIITEEAAAFFAGSKSAADTAAVIQSRIGIYVSEQS